MKISFLRAKRLAFSALLKAEKRRQQEREAEAKFYSDESAQQSVQSGVVSAEEEAEYLEEMSKFAKELLG